MPIVYKRNNLIQEH